MFATPAPLVPPEQRPRHTVDAVAGITGLSPATVRHKAGTGQWPHTRYGRGAIRFSDLDVLAILDSGAR